MKLSPTILCSLLGLSAIVLGGMVPLIPPAHAQGQSFSNSTPGVVPEPACRRPVPLMPVGGSDPEVVKRVSPPGFIFTRSNWNTDFIVTSNYTFSSFLVRVFFKDAGNYSVEANLKYGDGTADRVYDSRVSVQANELFRTYGYPRRQPGRSLQPYQVHVKVGNTGTIGNIYVLSVYGCS